MVELKIQEKNFRAWNIETRSVSPWLMRKLSVTYILTSDIGLPLNAFLEDLFLCQVMYRVLVSLLQREYYCVLIKCNTLFAHCNS